MLLFTEDQQLHCNAERNHFNGRQSDIAKASGIVGGFGGEHFIGNAAQIPLDAWRRIDQEAIKVQRSELVMFNRLAAANSKSIGLGDLVNFLTKVSDSGTVNVSMDGRSKSRADQAVLTYEGTPVPIYDSQASFGWRQMQVMRKGSSNLDVEAISSHQRKIAEKLEDVTLNGYSAINVGGATIYGLRTFPQRSTGTHGITLKGAAGEKWLQVFEELIYKHLTDKAFGRVTVFLSQTDYTYADLNEFTAGYPKTILQRLREVSHVAEIVPVPSLNADELISIADVASGKWGTILNGMPIVTRPQVRHNPEDEYVFTVIAAAVPQFKSDYNGRSQIVHLTKD